MILPRLVRPAFRSRARLFSASATARMKVIPVPVRDDNYAYLLVDEASNKAAAVDPYDVPKVQAAADKAGVEIVAGITTHHHHDHSGGNEVCGRAYADRRRHSFTSPDRDLYRHLLPHTLACPFTVGATRSLP